MTPLLLLALLATPTTTIPPTDQGATMAQQANSHGTPSPGGHPPVYNPGSPFSRGAGLRVGRDASNPGNLPRHGTHGTAGYPTPSNQPHTGTPNTIDEQTSRPR